MWTRALTKAELDILYNGGTPLAYGSISPLMLPGIVSYLDFADTTQTVSGIDGSLFKSQIGQSKHPGGWFFENTTAYAGGVLLCPYVSQANRATLYP